MIGDILALAEYVQKHSQEYSTKSALVSWDGTRISGDDLIVVEKLPVSSQVWFYKVQEREGYEFIYMPTIPSIYIDNGKLKGEDNADAKIFRFVGSPLSLHTKTGLSNVKVNFTIIGYKPLDLLGIRETLG